MYAGRGREKRKGRDPGCFAPKCGPMPGNKCSSLEKQTVSQQEERSKKVQPHLSFILEIRLHNSAGMVERISLTVERLAGRDADTKDMKRKEKKGSGAQGLVP